MKTEDIKLTAEELDAVLSGKGLKVPDETGVFRGVRCSMTAKVGGRMQWVQVMCEGEPYEREIKGGKKALYVDVFGYGVKKSVNIKRLRLPAQEDQHG